MTPNTHEGSQILLQRHTGKQSQRHGLAKAIITSLKFKVMDGDTFLLKPKLNDELMTECVGRNCYLSWGRGNTFSHLQKSKSNQECVLSIFVR